MDRPSPARSLALAVHPTLAVAFPTSLPPSRLGRAVLPGAAAVAQLADLLTYSPAHELNPLVQPETAIPLKAALMVLVLAVSVGHRWVLGVAAAAGLVGFVSNVIA